MTLFSVFLNAILPILSIAVVGYIAGIFLRVDVQPMNTITLYVLFPALVFHTLGTTSIGGADALRISLGVIVYTMVMIGLSEGVCRLSGTEEPIRSSTVLTSSFPNCGNYGIPLSSFVFGPIGRLTAIIYVTVQGFLVYTVGVFIASRGAGESGGGSFLRVFKLPLIYAALAAVGARWLNVLPDASSSFMRTMKMLGDSAIPLMLIILGVQLAGISKQGFTHVVTPSVLKTLVAPMVAGVLVLLGGFDTPDVARVFVLECTMPSAVAPLLLVGQYERTGDSILPSQLVSSVIVTTTVLSVPTLAIMIVVLQSGWFV